LTGTFNINPPNAGDKHPQTRVYCPISVPVTEKLVNFAPRINTFEKKRVGLLWNGKPNGDFFLNRVGELLKQRYKEVRIIKFWELDPNGTAQADKKSDETLDFIARNADFVITDSGD
jgi:hypothetical protein